ncbi:fumarylacetoacetate hydrolase family protein (plasmid) [Leisingera sp. M527]|uniref:fumarylacetoacetate hydrolase family protein n=1 Tax=Leisingera sp. M527 TaxID=2867014 RepID=UPI0021A80716|nr:fumarylacetoacetate hydrolase family protein [Leisingera sp. M527]UWQ35444.1 fumarylacetoacetate hydrolase family protein [Leisingera sp. M527]
MSFRILNYCANPSDVAKPGLLINGRIYDLAKIAGGESGLDVSSTFALFQDWSKSQSALTKIAASVSEADGLALDDVTLRAPLLYPGAIFCTAANYSDHVEEMNHGYKFNREGFRPYFFLKAPPSRAIAHPDEKIPVPSHTEKLDWEAELAFVIGKRAKDVSADDAMNYVAGFTIINDLSARDHLFRDDWKQFKTDWFGQKCFDKSVPMGPWITPASEVPDLSDLRIQLWLNGELRQDTGTRFMIFNVAEQIEALSRQVTLEPGDIVATGTGAGVGGKLDGRDQEFLQPGDHLKIEIEGLGVLENSFV